MTSSSFQIGRGIACATMMATALLVPPHVRAADPETSSPPASAQQQTPSSETTAMASVVIDGRTVFKLRGISSFPAEMRVEGVATRIREAARNPSFAVSELRVVETQDRSNILAGDDRILSIFDLDANVEQLDNRQLLAEVVRDHIKTAIESYRYERSGEYLLEQGVKAIVALGVLTALLLGLRWLFRWFDQALERRIQFRIKQLEARSFRLLSAQELKSAWHGGVQSVHLLILVALVFAYVDFTLNLFPWTRYVALTVTALLIDPLKTMWSDLVASLPGLAFIAILFFVTRYLLRLAQIFFSGISYGTIRPAGFEQEWAWPTYRLLRLVVIIFALVIAYPYIPGSDSAAFKGISIFAGLLMSLGATSIVSNSLAGYMLIYRRAFRVGDRIKVGDVVGDVVEMRQQLTHLRTLKNEEVTIPSSVILNSNVVNYSSIAREGGLILHTTVGIGYETPWRQVEAMLIDAANRTEGLLREPPPFILQTALGDFCITYEINAYCDQPKQMPRLYTALHHNILDVFNEHGVQIMTPNYVADTAQPKLVPHDQWYAAPAEPPPAEK